MNARVNTAEDFSTAGKNLKFGPVTPEICWRVCTQDELTLHFAPGVELLEKQSRGWTVFDA